MGTIHFDRRTRLIYELFFAAHGRWAQYYKYLFHEVKWLDSKPALAILLIDKLSVYVNLLFCVNSASYPRMIWLLRVIQQLKPLEALAVYRLKLLHLTDKPEFKIPVWYAPHCFSRLSTKAGEVPCVRLTPWEEGSDNSQVASCYWNRDKLLSYTPLVVLMTLPKTPASRKKPKLGKYRNSIIIDQSDVIQM